MKIKNTIFRRTGRRQPLRRGPRRQGGRPADGGRIGQSKNPAGLHRQGFRLARLTRLERTTFCSGGRRSIQLSYRRIGTPGLTPKLLRNYSIAGRTCQAPGASFSAELYGSARHHRRIPRKPPLFGLPGEEKDPGKAPAFPGPMLAAGLTAWAARGAWGRGPGRAFC